MHTVLAWRPRVWGFAYLGLLVGAAVLYMSLPSGSFYDSNLHREASTREDESRLIERLTNAVRQVARPTRWHRDYATVSLWDQPKVMAVTTPASAGPERLAIELGGSVRSTGSDSGFEAWFLLDLEDRLSPALTRQPTESTYEAQPVGAGGTGIPVEDALQPPSWVLMPNTGRADVPTLDVVPGVAKELHHFYRALAGDPTAGSGNALRMLYFSASTVTTLGIGDIQPVSPEARLFVTLEAIFGVVFVGLFLNALARHVSISGDGVPTIARQVEQVDADADPDATDI